MFRVIGKNRFKVFPPEDAEETSYRAEVIAPYPPDEKKFDDDKRNKAQFQAHARLPEGEQSPLPLTFRYNHFPAAP
jgi:hypothetical protein